MPPLQPAATAAGGGGGGSSPSASLSGGRLGGEVGVVDGGGVGGGGLKSAAAAPAAAAPAAAAAPPARAAKAKMSLFHSILFGGTAGVIGQTTVFPMYCVKTRMHTAPGRYSSAFHCISKVLQHEGWRGLYRGMPPALLGVFPEKAIKLGVNDHLRERLAAPDGSLSIGMSMMAGAGAGFSQVIATNPMEMVMITMQTRSLQGRKSKSMAKVIRGLGLAGLYRGTSATLARDVPFSVVFFSLRARLEEAMADKSGKTPMSRVFVAGIVSGSTAAALSTPMDVVKTRLMAAGGMADTGVPPARMLPMIQKIWVEEGARGFFNGAVPRMLIISPLFGITLLFYEVQIRWGERKKAKKAEADTGG